MVYLQNKQSADADGTSGEKISAQQKAMIDRIEQSEKLIKRLRTKIRKLDSDNDELKSVKFIGVEFDPVKVKGATRFFKDMVKNDRELLDNVDLLAKRRNPDLAGLPIKDLRKTKQWQTSLNRFSANK